MIDGRAIMIAPDEYVYTGPGTLAGRFMRMFWQPVSLASEVSSGQAIPIRIMGEDFTLYRGHSGRPQVTAFRCAHRGTQLSAGWVEDDCIRCFYHGWKYDASGQCVEQPGEANEHAAKVRIRAYPTQEYLGLIFAYFGDDDPPPFRRYSQLEGNILIMPQAYRRECNFFSSIENHMDELHLAFVHRASTYTYGGLNLALPEVSGQETDYGIVRRGKRPGGATRVLHFLMPNLCVFKVHPRPDLGDTAGGDVFHWAVPIDDRSHRSLIALVVPVQGEAAERYRAGTRDREERNYKGEAEAIAATILGGEAHADAFTDRPDGVQIQDAVAQLGQGSIPDRKNERLGRSDAVIVELRRVWLRELQALRDDRALKQWTQPDLIAAAYGL